MTIRTKMRLAVLGIAAACGVAHAQGIGPALPPIPLACSLNDLSAQEQRVLEATAFLIPENGIHRDPITNTYSITTNPFIELDAYHNPTSTWYHYDVCPSSQLYGVETMGESTWGWGRGRSATLIGHNLFVTAAHDPAWSAAGYVVVFLPSGFPCTLTNLDSIPADNVYFPNVVDPNFENNLLASYIARDFLYFYVDRSVVDRKPLKIRRSGSAELGANIIQTGHSYWSGARIGRNGIYHGESLKNYSGTLVQEPLMSLLYPLIGASGGPVFNVEDEVLETVVAYDVNAMTKTAPCLTESFVDLNTFPELEVGATNASFLPMAALIPRQEVMVTPLDKVIHVAPLGGALAQPITSYQLQGGLSSNQYAIDPDPSMPVSGAPTLVSSIAPGDRLLSFVTPTTWTLTAGISSVSACGVWDYEYNVRDRHNLQNNYVRHRFEIGVKEIELAPSNGEDITDFGFPVGKTYTYIIRNVRPTAATLDLKAVSASTGLASSWLRIDGVTSKSVTLQPQGVAGDTVSVTLSVVEPMLGGATFPQSSFRIEHADPACALTSAPNLVLPFSLTMGRDRFSAIASGDDVNGPSGGASYGTPQVTTVTVSEPAGYCVSDMNARIGLMDRIVINAGFPEAAERIRVRLKSPLGTQVTLWDKQSVPSSGYLESVNVSAYGQEFPSAYLVLDDESTPPLVGALSAFDGEPVEGNWEVEVAVGQAGATVIPIQHVLDISVTACPP